MKTLKQHEDARHLTSIGAIGTRVYRAQCSCGWTGRTVSEARNAAYLACQTDIIDHLYRSVDA